MLPGNTGTGTSDVGATREPEPEPEAEPPLPVLALLRRRPGSWGTATGSAACVDPRPALGPTAVSSACYVQRAVEAVRCTSHSTVACTQPTASGRRSKAPGRSLPTSKVALTG
jgi:hypothetical protein